MSDEKKYLIAVKDEGKYSNLWGGPCGFELMLSEALAVGCDFKMPREFVYDPVAREKSITIALSEVICNYGEDNVRLYEYCQPSVLNIKDEDYAYVLFLRNRGGVHPKELELMVPGSSFFDTSWEGVHVPAKEIKDRYDALRPRFGCNNLVIAREIGYSLAPDEKVVIPDLEKEKS